MAYTTALPFTLKRSEDVIDMTDFSVTTETIHGLLRLEERALVMQWRVARKIETMSGELRTDQEVEAVREVSIPLEGVAGSSVRMPRWWPWGAPRFVLTASDLQAFEAVAGESGLKLAHPAELVLRIRRTDRLAAEEFSAELAMAVAKHALARGHERELMEGDEGGGGASLPPAQGG